jgi:hypothetical protein
MGVRSVNNSLQQFLDTFVRSGTDAVTPAPPPSGLTATGGVISDYVDGPAIYRAHIFTSSGTFVVSALGSYGSNVEYLVVAGGGGGGAGTGGGGGAGGYRSSVSGENSGGGSSAESLFSISPGSYSVTIGAGGNGATGPQGGPSAIGTPGGTTSFGPISSTGGGGGGTNNLNGNPGGSGGGGGHTPGVGGPATANQGYSGGNGSSSPKFGGGGGGGAGEQGNIGQPGGSGNGGNGLRTAVAGPQYPIGTPGPGPTTGGWLADRKSVV